MLRLVWFPQKEESCQIFAICTGVCNQEDRTQRPGHGCRARRRLLPGQRDVGPGSRELGLVLREPPLPRPQQARVSPRTLCPASDFLPRVQLPRMRYLHRSGASGQTDPGLCLHQKPGWAARLCMVFSPPLREASCPVRSGSTSSACIPGPASLHGRGKTSHYPSVQQHKGLNKLIYRPGTQEQIFSEIIFFPFISWRLVTLR